MHVYAGLSLPTPGGGMVTRVTAAKEVKRPARVHAWASFAFREYSARLLPPTGLAPVEANVDVSKGQAVCRGLPVINITIFDI